jgi:hypothetical protein
VVEKKNQIRIYFKFKHHSTRGSWLYYIREGNGKI